MQKINYIKLKNYPIFQQLQLEEALLKATTDQWCLINEGTSAAVVMGISGKEEVLVDQQKLKNKNMPLIRRFTGGGTVVVDENTLFTTFICNSDSLKVQSFPEHVLRWSHEFFLPIFDGHPFQIRENDYVMGDLKFGGNAQYMRKQRWLHHSSLLWDFDPEMMEVLHLPPKMPAYRERRSHLDFLCTLKDYFSKKEAFFQRFEDRLSTLFKINNVNLNDLESVFELPYYKSTEMKDGCN